MQDFFHQQYHPNKCGAMFVKLGEIVCEFSCLNKALGWTFGAKWYHFKLAKIGWSCRHDIDTPLSTIKSPWKVHHLPEKMRILPGDLLVYPRVTWKPPSSLSPQKSPRRRGLVGTIVCSLGFPRFLRLFLFWGESLEKWRLWTHKLELGLQMMFLFKQVIFRFRKFFLETYL